MTRVTLLRMGYAALGLAFLSLAFPTLLPLGLATAFLGGVLLALSDDDLPKWAGITLVAYFLVTALVFLSATPITIRRGGRFYVPALAPGLGEAIFFYLATATPLMLAAGALAASWEREKPVRFLLIGAGAGFIIVAILTIALQPADPLAAAQQGSLLFALGVVSAISGAIGAGWAATRPEALA